MRPPWTSLVLRPLPALLAATLPDWLCPTPQGKSGAILARAPEVESKASKPSGGRSAGPDPSVRFALFALFARSSFVASPADRSVGGARQSPDRTPCPPYLLGSHFLLLVMRTPFPLGGSLTSQQHPGAGPGPRGGRARRKKRAMTRRRLPGGASPASPFSDW